MKKKKRGPRSRFVMNPAETAGEQGDAQKSDGAASEGQGCLTVLNTLG